MRLACADLGPVLLEAVETYRDLGAQKGLEVRYAGPLDARALWTTADADRVRQVFDNLLNNAVKFTDSGEGIWITARQAGAFLEFAVHDSGEGIEDEVLERIFELYEQAGGAVSRKQGTGIGLPYSRLIVEAHGGRIGVRTAPGAGSTFHFSLPRAQSSDAHSA